MIARIRGKVVEKFDDTLIVDVNGVGYAVMVGTRDFDNSLLDHEITLSTYDYLRENSHELFGFTRLSVKRLFEQLVAINGVGPKMALAVVSLGTEQDVRNAISRGHVAYISQASGVGKRIAQRIVVELKDKIGGITSGVDILEAATKADDARDALISLGYSVLQTESVLAKIDPSLPVQERIKQALKEM